jgi:alkaline phosphatase D
MFKLNKISSQEGCSLIVRLHRYSSSFGSGLLILFLLFNSGLLAQNLVSTNNITVVLSLDGFRWDYPSDSLTPNLMQIASNGVRAKAMIPSFPSKTFPNHYTLATGLYPDHHGLVNNTFYDPDLEITYSMSDKSTRIDPRFYGGEPIWVTASKQGIKTASFYWVGSELPIKDIQPDYWKPYNQKVTFVQRIDSVVKWLLMPDSLQPKLIMLYYHEPDGVGHEYGPFSTELKREIKQLDSLTGLLYTRIRELPVGNRVNLIILSDHGMGPLDAEKVVALRDFIPETWPVTIKGGNPDYNIYADAYWADSVYATLRTVKGMTIWKASDVPDYLNYGTNIRCGNLVAVADSVYSLVLKKDPECCKGGTHGYDIRNTDMHTIFFAAGPSFKQGYVHPVFRNVDVYPLLARLLNIQPAPTDGQISEVETMLR